MPRPLVLLLVLAALEALAWIAVVPALQGPDEPAHFSYVQNLAENGEAPKFDRGTGIDSTEVGSALTFLNLRALAGNRNARQFASEADEEAWRNVERGLPEGARKNAGGPNAVGKNPPLYYAYEAVPYLAFQDAPLLTRMFWMRVVSALLFVATVLFAWLLAAELFARTWPRVVAAGFVLLQPTLSFLASVINPDTMQACLWTAFLWIAVRTLLRGPRPGRLAALGLLPVAVLLTHGRGIALAPVALVALVLIAQRHRPRWRRPLLWSLGVGVPLALAFLVWRITSDASGPGYGGELNIPPEARDPGQFLSFVWQFYLPKLGFMDVRIGPDYGFRQFWIEGFLGGRFGALETTFSPATYDLITMLALSVAVLLVVAVAVRRDLFVPRWDVVVLLLTAVVCLLLFLHFASFRALSTQDPPSDPLIVGRYLLPLTALVGVALATLAASLRRHGPLVGAVVIAAAVVHQVAAWAMTLARFHG